MIEDDHLTGDGDEVVAVCGSALLLDSGEEVGVVADFA